MSKKNKKGFYDYLEIISKNGSNISKIGSGLIMGVVSTVLVDKVTKINQKKSK